MTRDDIIRMAREVAAPPQREWVGLTAKDLAEIPASCYEGAIWADAKLKEKNYQSALHNINKEAEKNGEEL